MIYVCSDLHGFPLENFKSLLKKADFGDNDTLYILGDVIDRNGDGGIEMLRWIMKQKNVKLLRGNHEQMLIDCVSCLGGFAKLDDEGVCSLEHYLSDGGGVTLDSMLKLKEENKLEYDKLIEFIRKLPLYSEITIAKQKFLLVHSGLRHFKAHRKIADYEIDDVLWNRPDINDKYFKSKTVVFGHTPTVFLDKQSKGRIYHSETWIDIDVGACSGMKPALLRLDDMKEFYAD